MLEGRRDVAPHGLVASKARGEDDRAWVQPRATTLFRFTADTATSLDVSGARQAVLQLYNALKDRLGAGEMAFAVEDEACGHKSVAARRPAG